MDDERRTVVRELERIMKKVRRSCDKHWWVVSYGPSNQEFTIREVNPSRRSTILNMSDPKFFDKFEAELVILVERGRYYRR